MSTFRSTYVLVVANMSLNMWLDASCSIPPIAVLLSLSRPCMKT